MEHVAANDLRSRAAMDVAARRGHDLFAFLDPPASLQAHALPLDDVVTECEQRFGKLAPPLSRATYDPRTRHHFALAGSWTPAPLHYRTDWWEDAGVRPDTWDQLREGARKIKLGNGLDAGTEIGPMFEKKAMDNTLGLVEDARKTGAKVLTGGKRSDRFDKGYFFEPTVLTGVTDRAKIMTEEPFAPVMPVLDFSKTEEVIAQANNTRYGLAAYVFTNDLTTVWKMAEGLEAACRHCLAD